MSTSAFRQRLVAVYDADTQVRAVTGRTTGSIKAWGRITHQAYPVLSYYFVDVTDQTGIHGIRSVLLQVDAWGNADPERGDVTSISDLETLISRAEALFTGEHLNQAGGLDCAVSPIRSGGDDPSNDGTTYRIRREFTIELR